jgi:zinc/manganese transport system substrate-binding protein
MACLTVMMKDKDHGDDDHDDHDDQDDHGDDHDEDKDHSGDDPHFLTDPLTLKQAIPALTAAIADVAKTNLDLNSATVVELLDAVHDAVVKEMTLLGEVPCKLVTGHNSMRYFADRYGCEIIGAIIPSASSTAEATAGSLAQLRQVAKEENVRAIFVDEGTSDRVASQIASELGITVFQLASHTIPSDGSYSTYVVGLAETIVEGLTQN